MNGFRDLPKKKKIVLAVAFAAVLLAGGYLLFERQPEARQTTSTPTMSAADKKFYAENDKKKQESLNALLGIIAGAYNGQRKEYPTASQAGWSSIMDTVSVTESFFDPYTDSIYTFTDKDPEYGEIQYGPGMTCDKDKTLKPGYGSRSLALRAKFSDGYRCVNSFQG